MDLLQFWEWGIWPWLGNVIASQPFLTLMVPVATLTGVVITTKSNERIRRRELQGEGQQWRYEVEKDNAAVQRQAVLTFLAEVADLKGEMSKCFSEAHELLVAKGGLKSGEYETKLIDLNWTYWSGFSSKVDQHLVSLELSLADELVRAQATKVRKLLRDDKEMFTPPGGERGTYPDPNSNPFFTSSSPMSTAVEMGLEKLKEEAANRLHPLPPEVSVEQPSRRWWSRSNQDSLTASREDQDGQDA